MVSDDQPLDSPVVTTDVADQVLVITIRREHKRNALNQAVTLGIDAALNRLEDDEDLRCAILTGGERMFSAGADLVEGPGERTARGGQVGMIRRHRSKPLIAAVEGIALGGGLELILACDLVVASSGATFGVPEPRIGMMPAFGGAFRLNRILPANVATEMLLTGDSIDATRAERLGLVNVLCENGKALESARTLATRICANAPLAVKEVLAMAHAELYGDESDRWQRSDLAHARLLASKDVAEGMGAFFARRAPKWSGE